MKKKRQQGKRRNSNKLNNSTRSSRIIIKHFEIFVTDFLTDPCGLPVELKDCVLVDGKIPINENSDICSSNNSQVLKNVFSNSLTIEESCKTTE